MVDRPDRSGEQQLERSGRSQRTNADLEPVRHMLAFELQILHIPEVAELVLHARRRTARLGSLHCKPLSSSPSAQLLHLLHIAVVDPFGIAQRLLQTVLHHVERECIDRLRPHGIGDHPVGTGRNLGDQIGIARCRHRHGSLGRDLRIEGHARKEPDNRRSACCPDR